MSRILRFAGVLVLGIAASVGTAPAQKNFYTINVYDQYMIAAKQKARETLPDFLTLAKTPRPATEGFSLKIGINDGGETEFFWITPFEEKNGEFSGVINNKPEIVRSVSLGQRITFKESDIADWLYMDGGQMKGNYTACALIKREPVEQQEAFKKRYGLECDL